MPGENPETRELQSLLRKNPIAVIGMASIFPGASNLFQYWENILHEIDSITPVPEDRWKISDYYDPDPAAPDKTYSRVGGFLPEIDFDPMEFGLPPNILEVTDVSQLLALIVAREVMEDAGYNKGQDRSRVGVTLGVGGGQKLYLPLTSRLQYPVWKEVLTKSGLSEDEANAIVDKIKKAYIPWEENSFPGMLGNVIAGRVANRLDLGGMNCVLDAACGGSLAAMKMAVSDLAEGRSDMMITGGVDTDNSPFMYLCFAKTPALSKKEYCSPFDENSDGILIGEGVGMVLLKRLEDAQRDNDRIYAVIKGVGASSDGRFKSIYAPRPEGQARALKRAYRDAGFSPAAIGLVEAHATGTVAGDMAEFTALKSVFGEETQEKGVIAIGSVKSQIGHTKTAAGTAGFIKAALALHHKILPPTINVTKPNPKLGMEDSPFYINTTARPWALSNGMPRRASVSAFGFGGSNFHFILEEAPKAEEKEYRIHRMPRTIVLHASTGEELQAACKNALANLEAQEDFDALAAAWAGEIPSSHPRVGFAARTVEEAQELLKQALSALEENGAAKAWTLPHGVFFGPRALSPDAKVAALFSGQGSQYVNMGREASLGYPQALAAFEGVDRVFHAAGEAPLTQAVFPKPCFDPKEDKKKKEVLNNTRFAQPAIGAYSAGLFNILKRAGLQPDFCAGHSFGEITALWASGVLDDQAFYTLAHARGKAMAKPDAEGFDPGAMLAVMGNVEKIKEHVDALDGVQIANFNSPKQVVCAGSTPAIKDAAQSLKKAGFRTVPLKVSAAFHTPLVGHAAEPFAKAIASVKVQTPNIPVYSNTTAEPFPQDSQAIARMMGEHILNPVRFSRQIENMYAAGARVFVEFGPKNVLTSLVGVILKDKPHMAIALDKGDPQGGGDLAKAAAQLRVAGVLARDIDPFQRPMPKRAKKQSPLNIKLNGSNYVSEKTRKAYQDSLSDGFAIERTVMKNEQPSQSSAPAPAPAPKAPEAAFAPKAASPAPAANPASANGMDQVIQRLFDLQGQTLSAHERCLENHAGYTQAFARLMESQAGLMSSQGMQDMPENMQRNMEYFHSLHGDTLRMHQKYLDAQTKETEQALGLLNGRLSGDSAMSAPNLPVQPEIPAPSPIPTAPKPAAPVIAETPPPRQIKKAEPIEDYQASKPEPVTPPRREAPAPQTTAANGPDVEQLATFMLSIVSEKTGYPASMLELSMDMEADLGIDSIKRVEILGAMMDAYPNLPEINPDELADLRTLQQVVDRLEQSVGQAPAPTAQPSPAAPAAPRQAASDLPDIEQLATFMLSVVSEKTGYPASMLELSMDMEADLGIDSIKRVEILGAMMDAYPNLPEINPDELADLRTLQQVADRLEKSASSQAAPAPPAAPTPVSHAPEAKPASPSGLPGLEELAEFMLQTVSEKTGYPASMLELSMDMEADLGIDSIKRVEILGAMMDAYPNLPEINPDELAELRTLQQVVDRLGAAMKPAKAKPVQAQLEFGTGGASVPVEAETPKPTIQPEAENTPVQRSSVKIKPLPPADRLHFDFPQDHVCVVISEGTGLTAELLKRLKYEDMPAVVILPPWASKSGLGEAASILLQDTRDESVRYALERAANDHGPIGGFLHLSPEAEDLAREGLELAFSCARHVKGSLTAEKQGDFRRFFLAVARMDGSLGMAGDDYSPIHGGLFGLVKTLDLEWPRVFCRGVDLDPALAPERAAKRIMSEIFDPDVRIKEAGYTAEGRMTLVPDPISEALPALESILREKNQVFLVSGGGRGVTAECVMNLAKELPAVFVLTGRSAMMEKDPDWADGCQDLMQLKAKAMEHLTALGEKPTPKKVEAMAREIASSREIRQTLQTIRDAGSRARYVSADVTQASDLKEKLAPVVKETGPFTGIIHGAGVLKDKFIEDKTPEDFNAVFSTKVDGLLAMLACMNPSDLKYLALFSSAAGFYGNPGQADYAAANEVLNKFAYAFASIHPSCKVVTINWGPWDGGMVSPELKRMFQQKKVAVIPLDEGAGIFTASLLGGKTVQLLVGSSMQTPPEMTDAPLVNHRVSRKMSLECNPFLPDHVIGDWAVLPTVCVMSWMADACEQFAPGYRFFRCRDYKLFKGIVFDKTLAGEYILDAEEVVRDAEKVELDVRIYSVKEGKRIPHYKAMVRLLAQAPDAPVYDNLDLNEKMPEDGAVFYKDGTLFHGPNFRMIQKVLNCTKEKLTLKACVPIIPPESQGQFPVGAMDPFTADVHFQSQLIWVRKHCEAGSLPARANTVEQYRPIAHGQEFFVTLDVLESSDTSMKADICAHDDHGTVYSRVFGAEVTVSKGLTKLFALAV
ncbi:type I polyketide synthase [Desulfatibacillum aliphaticivorans]|uniref:type I polyketide synthase n=1 Tax=Desulfatibacillum aliphaticivorans TaxID=218208 RepID=UPI00041B5E53|nr:type I polyketide synthase [Desulfatibacillum aliphaticivorans]